MKSFNSLPTRDGTFRTLTPIQRDYILSEMEIDYKEAEAQAKGMQFDPDHQYFDDDDSWWDDPSKVFEGIQNDPDELRKQLLNMSDADTKRRIVEKMEATKRAYDNADSHKAEESKLSEIMEARYKKVQEVIHAYQEGNTQALQDYKRQLRTGQAQINDVAPDKESAEDKRQRESLADKAMKHTLDMLNGKG